MVAQVLKKPMTGSEIRNAARPLSSRLQLRDVWHLMRGFQSRGLVKCLNPEEKTGKLYHLTEFGCEVVQCAYSIVVHPVPTDIDWMIYSRIARAKTRRWVLSELARPRLDGKQSLTATEIRRGLLERYPLGINPTIRALQELLGDRLVGVIGVTKKRQQKLYRISKAGEIVNRQIGSEADPKTRPPGA